MIFDKVIKYHRYVPTSYVDIIDCFRVGVVFGAHMRLYGMVEAEVTCGAMLKKHGESKAIKNQRNCKSSITDPCARTYATIFYHA